MKLTIAFITARKLPCFDWFLESLSSQIIPGDNIQIVIVDFFAQPCDYWHPTDVGIRKFQLDRLIEETCRICPPSMWTKIEPNIVWTPPMPSVWQGPNRLPKDNWWAKSSALNAALCHAKGKWFLHVDDRCVLNPGFMDAVRENMAEERMVFGGFEKRSGMVVENGIIQVPGVITRTDPRAAYGRQIGINPIISEPDSYYGCCGIGPLEWYLAVNGWDTTCDGLSFEDIVMGHMLANNVYPLFYDYRMMIIEDRTPGQCGPEFHRDIKGAPPHDKPIALLDMLKPLKRAKHNLDLREIRNKVLAGKPFPEAVGPHVDWFDGTSIKDF